MRALNHSKLMLTALIVLLLSPLSSFAQTAPLAKALDSHRFSYSIVSSTETGNELVATIRDSLMPSIQSQGGLEYAIWVSATKPDDAPFAGLTENQVGIMLAWPQSDLPSLGELDQEISSLSGITNSSSRLFEAIYLPEGLAVPTSAGFYVHREEEYSNDNVATAVRLSQEAWTTWEPHWGVTVIGLFRELGTENDVNNLNRIVWYPSHEGWLATRNFTEDPESAARFRQRRTLLIPGSGIAIATDRNQD